MDGRGRDHQREMVGKEEKNVKILTIQLHAQVWLFSVRYICEDVSKDDINLTAGLKNIINPPLHYGGWHHTSFQQYAAQTRMSPEHRGLEKSTEALS